MALYAGETTRIRSSAQDFEENDLTNVEVLSATVTIWRKSDDTMVLAPTTMDFDSDGNFWYYDWSTGGATPIESGTYLAKIRLIGATFDSWEYKRFKLQANPI